MQRFKGIVSWEQAGIWAACLGLTEEAVEWNSRKLADGPYRFPAFWGPGHDWVPDHNWGGSGMIGLQEMLMQGGRQPDALSGMAAAVGCTLQAMGRANGHAIEVKLQGGKGDCRGREK